MFLLLPLFQFLLLQFLRLTQKEAPDLLLLLLLFLKLLLFLLVLALDSIDDQLIFPIL